MMFSGPISISDDTGKCFPDLAQIRRLHLQKILGRPGVVARAGDRLRDFVRQRGGQFSHHAHAVHVGEIRLHLLQPRQRLRAIFDVGQQTVPASNTPGLIADRDAADFQTTDIRRRSVSGVLRMEGSTGGDDDLVSFRTRGRSSGCTAPLVPQFFSSSTVRPQYSVSWR